MWVILFACEKSNAHREIQSLEIKRFQRYYNVPSCAMAKWQEKQIPHVTSLVCTHLDAFHDESKIHSNSNFNLKNN